MNTELAGRLLDALLKWTEVERVEKLPRLLAMAELKYDQYEGFRAGQRFLESLVRWLAQMPDEAMRQRWLSFVLEDMVFISRAELDHAISVAYPDYLRPEILELSADAQGLPRYAVREVVTSPEFARRHRSVLLLGLSDGARMDLLRRSSQFSHEQFALQYDVSRENLARAREALARAVGDPTAAFTHVVLVDDFYGSGSSLVDHKNGELKGKIRRFNDSLNAIQHALSEDGNDEAPVIARDCRVSILLYCASYLARDHIVAALAREGLDWRVHIVQLLGDEIRVKDANLAEDCEWFYDPILNDEHKSDIWMGYRDCALPVVLQHNSPNNSVSPLWADSTGRLEALQRRALFPRYERHQASRP